MMALQAEVMELKASPTATPRGTVIEAQVEPGRGPTATVIVQMGTLKVGDPFICGDYGGKVKSLIDDRGKPIKERRSIDAGEGSGIHRAAQRRRRISRHGIRTLCKSFERRTSHGEARREIDNAATRHAGEPARGRGREETYCASF